MLKNFLLVVFLFVSVVCGAHGRNIPQQEPQKLGLTLSGGGAKGLAHIGVLHILDSLGIRVDYISGTSMGSIVGGMYAAGYSAREIEEFALSVNWGDVFSRRAGLEYTHPRRRESFGRFIVNLPIQNGRLILPSGAIEGQQLWNLLSDIFFHVRGVSDFNDLPIPFAAVATDIETGDAVVLRGGDIITVLRASMAIPSVFTTINIDGRKLIDGGVARNFPVQVVKEMGADFVVGVNVAQGLRAAEELRTPIDILYQLGFFLDARTFKEDRALTDLYVEPDLRAFTAASFGNVQQIIEQGKQAARRQLPEFLALQQQFSRKTDTLMADEPLFVPRNLVADSIAFTGLYKVRPWFVRNAIGISYGDTLTTAQLNSAVNRLAATDYFNRVTYTFEPHGNNAKGTLIFHFDEKPFGRLGAAIHYSSFTGVGLIGNLSTSKLFLYNTQAYVKALVGEKPALKAGIDAFLNDRQITWVNLEGQARHLVFPVYEDFEIAAEYKQSYLRTELTLNHLTGPNSYLSLGTAWYYQSLSPNMRAAFSVRGHTRSNELMLGWKHNSLNRQAFPQSGMRTRLSSHFFFNQKPSLTFRDPQGNQSSELSDVDIRISNYLQIFANWESFLRVSPRLTSFNQLQAGYNFFYDQQFINNFNLGGTYPFLKNQIVFAGLNEYEVLSKGIVAGAMGWQYNVWDEFFLTPIVNAALYNFEMDRLNEIGTDNFILGAGMHIGFLSAIGPLQVSFAFSPQTHKILAYINLGWTF